MASVQPSAPPLESKHHRDDAGAPTSASKRIRIERTTNDDESLSAADPPSEVTIVCPYLDTINRKVLDFDFEKLCSVTLSNMNVYACLVCGRYYQGRGPRSQANTHSLESSHHVFINLETEKIYCLPDGYEVVDPSLEDIRFNLHPKFRPIDLDKLDSGRSISYALDGTTYIPGLVGLNNIKNTDWLNVVVQALARTPPIRDFFMASQNYGGNASSLVHHFGELIRKMWNPRSFKGHVSPHELLQVIATESNKQFRIGVQSDPLQFLSWFLNRLHMQLGGTRARGSSIIYRTFQGEVRVETYTPAIAGRRKRNVENTAGQPDDFMKLVRGAVHMDTDDDVKLQSRLSAADDMPTTATAATPFLYLSLSLPATPLFKEGDRSMIPQIALFDLLKKFDGQSEELLAEGVRKKYSITGLPPYLLIHVKRFAHNNWFVEKNLTLVNFPVKNLDMRPYVDPEVSRTRTVSELRHLSVQQLKELAKQHHIHINGPIEKDELAGVVAEHLATRALATRYDLLANIVHEGEAASGAYKIYLYQKSNDTWYEVQDLVVHTSDTMAQQVALSESYIQLYELKKPEQRLVQSIIKPDDAS